MRVSYDADAVLPMVCEPYCHVPNVNVSTTWWVQPTHLEKYDIVQLEIFPKVRGEHKQYLTPPPRKQPRIGVTIGW